MDSFTKHNHFTAHGKPFFSIGGQTHNSSSYIPEDMEVSYASVQALGGNTIAVPVPWEMFEPEEGNFNEAFVHQLIDGARNHDLKLIFLWFATWKNGTMEYVPSWVKSNRTRFQRALLKDGSPILQLSAHCLENREADARAFRRLMETIREYDAQEQTVIAVQVENEAGILGGTKRDFSTLGQKAFEDKVPSVLIQYCQNHPESLLAAKWKKAGALQEGNWMEVFGRYGSEAVTAYAVASYIDYVAAEGKKAYDIFVYTNVWLDGGSRGMRSNLAGLDWPSGCAGIGNLDIYRAVCKALDTIAPDVYLQETSRIEEVYAAYAQPQLGYPLYVPESSPFTAVNSSLMLEAAGTYGAIGYHIFGCESVLNPDGSLKEGSLPVMHSFRMLQNAAPLLTGECKGSLHTIIQKTGEDTLVLDELEGGWKASAYFARYGNDWGSTDFAHETGYSEGDNMLDYQAEKGRGFLFQRNKDEFYLIGDKLRIYFQPSEPEDGSIPVHLSTAEIMPTNIEFLSVTEGHFDESGEYKIDKVRSGDEMRHGIWASWDCGVIRIKLLSF